MLRQLHNQLDWWRTVLIEIEKEIDDNGWIESNTIEWIGCDGILIIIGRWISTSINRLKRYWCED